MDDSTCFWKPVTISSGFFLDHVDKSQEFGQNNAVKTMKVPIWHRNYHQ